MLQSFPTKAKSAQRSGKKLVEYQFYGWDTTENWNSQQSKGSGGQWTKNMLLLWTLLTRRHYHIMSSSAPWCWMAFLLWIWSLENRRSQGARKKHKRLPRLALECFRPCFFLSQPHGLHSPKKGFDQSLSMQWPDWDSAKFSFAQLWGSSLCLCVSVNHQANLRWHGQKLCCNRRKAWFWMSAAVEGRDRVEELPYLIFVIFFYTSKIFGE